MLEDTLKAAFDASFRHPKKPENHDRMKQKCVRPLFNHLAGCSFGMPEAAIAAGKVAVLVEMLKREKRAEPLSPEALKPPGDLTRLKGVAIQGDWSFLNKIRGTSPIGFHYWHQASLLRS